MNQISVRKKYALTGVGVVAILVLLVLGARHFQGPASYIRLNNSKTKGPRNAPVTMVVYSDFQCPACRSAVQPVDELLKGYPEKIKLEFRHFPLERNHRWALTAASFAECAAEQGKFWEFHDRLFQDQGIWSVSEEALFFFARLAQEFQLDPERLEQCLANPETVTRIRREYKVGGKQGVRSTPTIFINGKMLVGASQLRAQGRAILDEALKKPGSSKGGEV